MNIDVLIDWFNHLKVEHSWVVQVFVVVFATLVINLIVRHLVKHIIRQLDKTKNAWDDMLFKALDKPLGWGIWLFGITFAIEIIEKSAKAVIFEAVGPIRDVGVVVLIGWFLTRFIRLAEAYLISPSEAREGYDETTVHAVTKLLKASVIITMALVAMQTLGYSISGVLAFGGIGGLAVGLAAKDLLANFFGGLILYLDRPFVIGDWVRSPDRNIEGTVEAIGWRLTCIRTFDKRPLYVPNSIFANIALENPSRMSHRRIYETIGIRYEDIDQMQPIINDVKAMLKNHDEIEQNQTMIVNFNAFAPSSVDFFVYTFTKTTNWIKFHEIKEDVLLKIAKIISAHGAEVAYPTSTIHLHEPARAHSREQSQRALA